ncbi:hypothetical protein DFQ14_104322 [Halopolyspora algeriensis]|uniref:Tetratricopeptide repeat protein n=1 Tax=Halopolyspora algeriensis TaxID=1500506 RepID=A0A368VSL9_9ACTN|nr:hypothetical protein [Halopolyspora algeriensis]RCW44731.1 hypothetical protein DFQ14_104322 [Halopolyspora algeriensis]TQM56088.1 hypothetical protein FHU43_0872 [Halopolyspora algeriensis]
MSGFEDKYGDDRRGSGSSRGGPEGHRSRNRNAGEPGVGRDHGGDRRSGGRYPKRRNERKPSGGSQGEGQRGQTRGGRGPRPDGDDSRRTPSRRTQGGENRSSGRTGGRKGGGDRTDRRGYSDGKEHRERPRGEDRRSGGASSDRSTQRGSTRGGRRDEQRDRKRPDTGPGKARHHGKRDDERSTKQAKARDRREKNESAETPPRPQEPELPEDVQPSELHGDVRRELRGLPKALADQVAGHLVAAGTLMESDPQQALTHARFARRRAARVAAVREANGLTAYHAGEWSEALTELRAARRMSGGAGHMAIMADCERALGRSQRAVELSRSPEAAELDAWQAAELRIVVAGARRDLGQIDASVVGLQTPDLDPQRQDPWSARLFYAYADNLLAAGRVEEAFTWFVHAAHADDEGETDAPERLDELVVRLGGPDAAEELVAEAESRASAGTAVQGSEEPWNTQSGVLDDDSARGEDHDGGDEGGFRAS